MTDMKAYSKSIAIQEHRLKMQHVATQEQCQQLIRLKDSTVQVSRTVTKLQELIIYQNLMTLTENMLTMAQKKIQIIFMVT